MAWVAVLVLVLAVHVHGAAAQIDPFLQCKQDAIASHNHFRAIHQAPALMWNDTLARQAQDRANNLASPFGCTAAFTLGDENVAGIGSDLNWTSPCSFATLIWFSSGVHSKFTGSKTPVADNAIALQQGFRMLSQVKVIWAAHTALGCGAAQSSSGCWSVVCRYSPADSILYLTPNTSEATETAYVKNVGAPVALGNLTAAESCNSAILSIHNHHRDEYQVPPMSWDIMLAVGAQAYANEVARHGCPWQSSNLGVLEVYNTWANGTGGTTCAAFAESSYREAAFYRFSDTPWTDNSQVMPFAFMVARNMTKVGCGIAQGPDGCGSTVCWYGPEEGWDDHSLFQDVRLPAPSLVWNASLLIDGIQCQQAALVRLNQYRADHSAPSLVWNASLAAVAQGLAASAANDSCDLSWLRDDSNYGVDGGSTDTASAADVCGDAVDYLYSQGNTTFNFTRTPMNDNGATYAQWHKFTQVIWKSTTQVGCGSAQGPSGCWVVICKYDPPGNVYDETAFIQNLSPSKYLTLPSPAPININSSNSNGINSSGSGHASSENSNSAGGTDGNSSHTVAIVVGVCVGGGVLLAVVAGFLIWNRRRKQNQRQPQSGIWGKSDKAPLVLIDNNTTTGFTGSSGHFDTGYMHQPTSGMSGPASGVAHIMAIPGLMTGELFTRSTALEYSWNSTYRCIAGITQAVQRDINDLQLDAMLQGSSGQVQDCPVVCLSKVEVKQQLQLLTDGLRGRGGAALVFKALWPSRFGPDALLAVKVMKDGYDANPYIMQSFAHEASVLASVRHPNVVKLYGYCLDPPNVCLIMELLPCSLKEVLYGGHDVAASTSELDAPGSTPNSPSQGPPSLQLPTHDIGKEGVPLTMSQVLQVSTEIAAGLAYLHDQPQQALKEMEGRTMPVLAEELEAATDVEQASASQKIVHRDLKPANILINSLGQIKISDFGLARRHDNTTIETKHVGAGTVPYQAPEILSGARAGALGMKATNRCDVYSMAMIFWELLSKRPPWKGLNEVNIITQVISNKRPELPAKDKAQAVDHSSLDLSQLPASLTALPAYNDIIRQCWA